MSHTRRLAAASLLVVGSCLPPHCEVEYVDCSSDDHCRPGRICASTGFTSQCVDAEICLQDQGCAVDEHCALRADRDEITATRTTCEPYPCTCDEDCPADFICGACSGTECTCQRPEQLCEIDDECGTDEHCRVRGLGLCSTALRMRKTCELEPCERDDDCPTGQTCDGLGCRSDLRVCTDDLDCGDAERCWLRADVPCKGEPRVRLTCESQEGG